MSEPVPPEKKGLSYSQIEILEDQGKKYTGKRLDTWQDGKGICASCKRSVVMRRSSKNERVIFCNELQAHVADDISECNSYQNFTQLSLAQMAEIATLIDPRPYRYKGYL